MVCQGGKYNPEKQPNLKIDTRICLGGVDADGVAAALGYVSRAGGQSLGIRFLEGLELLLGRVGVAA